MLDAVFRIIWVFVLLVVLYFASLRIARCRKRWWLLWYAIAAIVLFAVNAPRIFVRFSFLNFGGFKPMYAISTGWYPIIVTSLALMIMFATIKPKIPEKRVQRLMLILIVIVQIRYVFLPLGSIIYYHEELAGLETTIFDDVCMQSTDYTCGPAAAVTALRYLGIDATESELALAADTVPLMGTDDRLLANAIENLYGDEGITCSVEFFNSIEEMKGKCPILMVIKFSFMIDHFVTVLDIDDEYVILGDPTNGRISHSHSVFLKEWRQIGIVVQKTPAIH